MIHWCINMISIYPPWCYTTCTRSPRYASEISALQFREALTKEPETAVLTSESQLKLV